MRPTLALALFCGLGAAGCATLGDLPGVDLADPQWEVWRGQALWRPESERPAVAGELIAARHSAGDVFVSFSKPPLPLFTARTRGRAWRIEFAARERSYSGRGRPPKRFVWFRLPDLLAGAGEPAGWHSERTAVGEWTLRHAGRGETLRLVLDP